MNGEFWTKAEKLAEELPKLPKGREWMINPYPCDVKPFSVMDLGDRQIRCYSQACFPKLGLVAIEANSEDIHDPE